MENGFLWREPEKRNLSSLERIGFHSVATVWFSFHWLFWLLRKKRFNMVDSSAGSMFSSATGIFLSFLHAKVGRERLVYFIARYHIVLNLYFIKWVGLNYVGLNIKSLLVTFVLSGTALAITFLISLLLDSITLVWFPSMLNKRILVLCLSSTARVTMGGQISTRAGVIAW